MKNVYEVLRQKEEDRLRIQSEIEALRLVIPLLDENSNQPVSESGNHTSDSSIDTKDSPETANNADKAPSGSWWKLASH
jgi:hypothetical protein